MPDWTPRSGIFTPIVVGTDEATQLLTDRGGVNISDWRSCAEMRAHFYVWANLYPNNSQTPVGFFHYRRSLLFDEVIGDTAAAILRSFAVVPKDLYRMYLNSLELESIVGAALLKYIDRFDIILPEPIIHPAGIAAQYKACHKPEDWDTFVTVASRNGLRVAPDTPHLFACNLFIMRVGLFHGYMMVWQKIMRELHHILKIDAEGYQHRTLGFLSERLFTTWLAHTVAERPTLRVAELPLLTCA